MPNLPKDVTVDVTLESSDPVKFTVSSNSLPKGPDGELIFNNDGHDGFKVDFVFTDGTGEGYLFPPNSKKDEAVWSHLGTDCPSQQVNPVVFQPIHINVDRTSLTVRNTNKAPNVGPFAYTLRVTKDNGTHYLPLDPGGLNQNGPTASEFSLKTIVVGLAVAAFVAIGLYELGVFNR